MIGESTIATIRLIKFNIKKQSYDRFHEMCVIENEDPNKLLEKLIQNYIPVPAVRGEFKFIPIYLNYVANLRRTLPNAHVVFFIGMGSKILPDWKDWREYKKGIISFEEFRRKYVEKLMGEPAQKRIEELKQLNKTRDIYIACNTKDEEKSIRKVLVDYIGGKLIWK